MEDNEKKLTSQTEGETIEDNDDNQYEHICYVCRRPESKAGKMITMPGGMCLCHDCMQKSFDAIMKNGMDFSQLQNMPYMNMNLNDFNNLNIPGMEIPKKQKIKKKSEKEAQPAFDLKNIPAPHKIKGELDQYVIGQEQAKKVIAPGLNSIGTGPDTSTIVDSTPIPTAPPSKIISIFPFIS